jgi:hypothetical protein
MANCKRCGRNLINPNADYGWRCAKKIGIPYGDSWKGLANYPDLLAMYKLLSENGRKEIENQILEFLDAASYWDTAMESVGFYDALARKMTWILRQEGKNGFITISGSPISDWQAYNRLDKSYIRSINCYAYAMGMPFNPFTGKKWGGGIFQSPGMQPGMFSDGDKGQYFNGEEVARLVSRDAAALGLTFKEMDDPNKSIPQGTWKIAIAWDVEHQDFHFYRQNEDGTWSHKLPGEKVKNTDANGKLIYNPEIANRGNYGKFIGFYYVGYQQEDESF